ncbi:oligosaccharide flippase family protein, partial [Candidatus Woesebacteria bacterium]|nr:oligosaccharide flippase family protein [Candidatus Woesebacteria bacterium]
MIQKMTSFLRNPTSKNVIINTAGNYLNVAFTAFFALILVRILTPESYGVLSVLLGISYVLANVLEFGTTASIYSTIPALFQTEKTRMYRFIKSVFFFQSLFAIGMICILIVSFPWLDRVFFKTGAPISDLYLTSVAVLFFIWQNFLTNILFAAKRFLRANVYINGANITKTIFIVVASYFGNLNVGLVIIAFGIVGPMTFFLLMLWRNKTLIAEMAKAEIRKSEFQFQYTMTYFAASQFYNLGLRMDLFLLSFFGLRDEVGYYGLSQKIILTIIASIVSISQVLSPKFATIRTRKEAMTQIHSGLLYMLVPSGIFILLYFTPSSLFELIFTRDFTASTQITHMLAIPFILNALGTIPNLFLLYTVRKPVYILISNIAFFAIITGGSYTLIPE